MITNLNIGVMRYGFAFVPAYGRIERTMAKRILVVEDDADIREVLIDALKLLGYSAESASNGQEALERLAQMEPPGLILLDLMMPVMNGQQFRLRQLEDPRIASIPVAVISADGQVPEKIARLGVAEWLPKPISLDALSDLVKKYCEDSA